MPTGWTLSTLHTTISRLRRRRTMTGANASLESTKNGSRLVNSLIAPSTRHSAANASDARPVPATSRADASETNRVFNRVRPDVVQRHS